MPHAAIGGIIEAGLTAGGALGGALFQRSAQKHAVDAQQKATDEALAYQRQKDDDARRLQTYQDAEYRRQYMAYLHTYYPKYADALGPDPTPQGLGTPKGGATPTQGAPSAPAQIPAGGPGLLAQGAPPQSLGAMMGSVPDPAQAPALTGNGGPPDATAPKSLADMGWGDWRRYGVN